MGDDTVVPIGARLGSERLYADARAGADDSPKRAAPAPQVAGPAIPPSVASVPSRVAGPARSELVSTVLELTGITALTAGCWLIAPYVGLIVAGVCLIVLGVAIGADL